MNTETKPLPFKLSLARGRTREHKLLNNGYFLEQNGTRIGNIKFLRTNPHKDLIQKAFLQRTKRGFPASTGWQVTDIAHVAPYRWDIAWENNNVVVTETGPFLHLPERSMEILASFNIGQSQTGTWRTLPENVSQHVVGEPKDVSYLLPLERRRTIVAPEFHFNCEDHTEVKWFRWDNYGCELKTNSPFLSAADYKHSNLTQPCLDIAPDVDLWVDPLWPTALFVSNRLADALKAENLDLGNDQYGGWNFIDTRTATPEEKAMDLCPEPFKSMDQDTFSNLTYEEFTAIMAKTKEENTIQGRIAYAMEQKKKSPPTHH
jgi:hypothetical protein